jgi:hypothetical protein
MPNPFSYVAWDLLAVAPLDTLPYQNVTFGQTQNQPGAFAGALPLASPVVQAMNWNQSTLPSKTALFVDFSGTLVWGGIIWTRTYQKSDPTRSLKVGAMTFGSYFQSRLQAADYSNTWSAGADPMSVIQRVLSDAQAKGTVFGGITLVLNPVGGEGGPLVVPSYPATALQTIDSIISTLSQMGFQFGPDYSFDVAYLPGTQTPAVTLNLWYPRQGRTYGQSQLVVLGADCVDYTYPEDGTQQATSVTETGSGTGGIQPADATALLPGYPLLERTFARTFVNDEGTLANIAIGDLGLYCYPVVTPTITIPIAIPDAAGNVNHAHIALGDFTLGDDLLWRIDPVAGGGLNTDPRFPHGMQFEWRISSWTATVRDTGLSTILFDLAIPPIQTIPPPQPPV